MRLTKLVTAHGKLAYDADDAEDIRVVRRYAKLMDRGKSFPLIEGVKVKRKGKTKFMVTDGNHRLLAWRLRGKKHIPFIEIVGEYK